MSAVQVCVLYKITKVHLKPRACTHVNIDNYNDYFNQPNHLKDVKFGERERERVFKIGCFIHERNAKKLDKRPNYIYITNKM